MMTTPFKAVFWASLFLTLVLPLHLFWASAPSTEASLQGVATPEAAGEVLAPSTLTALFEQRPAMDLPTTRARPLFSPTRRTFVAVAPLQSTEPATTEPPNPPAPPAVVRPDFKLKGILRSDTASKALLLVEGASAEKWLALDDTMNDWRLVLISDNLVVLEHGDERIELKLYVDNPGNRLAPGIN